MVGWGLQGDALLNVCHHLRQAGSPREPGQLSNRLLNGLHEARRLLLHGRLLHGLHGWGRLLHGGSGCRQYMLLGHQLHDHRLGHGWHLGVLQRLGRLQLGSWG